MNIRTTIVAAGALAYAAFITPSHAAFTLSDVRFWAGVPAGENAREAVLVIDWNDGAAPLAWGYRWPAAEAKTGADLLNAIVGADPRLSVSGGDFVSFLRYDANGDGIPERSQASLNDPPYTFWGYFVNNAVIDGTPPTFEDAAHVLPPNGNPYDGAGPGAWVSSSTGYLDRPLADGSFDGWVYANWGETSGPLEPVAALPVPEPLALTLAASGLFLSCLRRTRRA